MGVNGPFGPPAPTTLGDAVLAVRHALPPELVGPSALRRVVEVARQVPAALTSVYYLETRLGSDNPDVDLIFVVHEDGRPLLLQDPEGLSGDARHPAWEAVRRLCAAWKEGATPGARAIHHLWLEFDVPETPASDQAPIPGVFVCFGELRHPAYTPSLWTAHTLESMGVLDPARLTPGLRERIAACVAALPAGAYLPYAGAMLGRTDRAVRLCITHLPHDRLVPYLREVGWRGSLDEVAERTRLLSETQPEGPLRGPGMVHLDVEEEGITRLGIEFACQRGPQVRGGLAEAPMLDALVAAGLCTPARQRALLSWPGAGARLLPNSRQQRVLVRRLNHVKLVFRPGMDTEAKGYLGTWSYPRAAAPAVPSSSPAHLAPHSKAVGA